MLASDIPTFAHALGAAGYEVTLGGRMHFIGPDQRHGFHRRLVGDISGRSLGHIPGASTGQSRIAVEVAGPGRTGYQAYDEEVLKACQEDLQRKAAEASDEPFCLVAGFVLPHCPFIAPKHLYDYYHQHLDLPLIPDGYFDEMPAVMQAWRKHRGIHDLTEDEIRAARVGYYGLVEYFDDTVGRLLGTLTATGLADNTIVIYTSDHGESAGENGLWWKMNFYEGSIGVPLIISAPGRFPEGIRRGEVVSVMDLAPTLVEMAGGDPMPAISGQNLVPLLAEWPAAHWRDEAFAETIGSHMGDPPGRMIRRGPWKLIHYEGHRPLLFNLDEDPHEFVDRAEAPECREVRAYLHDRVLQGWDPHRAERILARRKQDLVLLGAWGQVEPEHR